MIQSIEFRLLSPQMIKKMSAVEITKADLYDNDGFPIEGGVMDPHLGVIDPGLRCRSCGSSKGDCFGHFGHIELVRPVIHVLYAKLIYKLLKNSCSGCGRIMVSEGAATAKKKCPHCGQEQKNIKFEKPSTFIEDGKLLSQTDVRAKLEKIPDEDLKRIGLKGGRPEWLVITLLPIAPVTVRPSITLETGERSEDDLTHKLVDIIRINQRLKENIAIGAPDFIIEDLWELLQYHVSTFFDNELSGIPQARHRSGRPLKTLAQRLKSKEGRFRQNLSGKRVNFSARTVISPDPCISINEVGVPLVIAQELTVPVFVTENNIEPLRQLVMRKEWPSANYVVRQDGRRKKITDENREDVTKEIALGYIVERHLDNGDIVLFNRQPSLHRMSMMAHRVRVTPWRTFTLNLSVCVAQDTKVLLGGTQRRIEELKNCWKESQVMTYDIVNKSIMSTELKAFWGLKPEQCGETCHKITTNTGREITATGDHPFYTNDGKKPAKELNVSDKVIVYPQEFPEYEDMDFEIVSENDIVASAPEETYIKHTLEELKKRGLIPLKLLNNPKAIILARLLGHLFGDGTFILREDESRAIFRGDEEDLKNIRRDIEFIGFEPEKIVRRSSKGKIRTAKGKTLDVCGTGCSFEVRSKPFGILLNVLGAPNGDKVKNNISIPSWIARAPAYIKKEFLSAYFGCELSKPKLRKSCKKMFKEPVFKLSKTEDKIESGVNFAGSIIKILDEDFGIKATVSKESGNIRKDGAKTVVIKTTIRSDAQNLINFYGKMGYAYNKTAEILARYAYQYLKVKRSEIERRNRILEKVKSARRCEIIKIAKEENIPVNTFYQWRCKNQNRAVTSPDFSDFDVWVEQNSAGSGFVFEIIENIEEKSVPYVYDITTSAETHNFIANGFLTGNCPPYNADFDGDEMNLHVPQTEEARAELELLMEVQKHIRSPRFGGPIIGCRQDHILGCYSLTKKQTLLTKEKAFSLLAETGLVPELQDKKSFSGKEVFSYLLPKSLNIQFKAKACRGCERCKKEECQNDCYVVIHGGKLKCGVIDAKAIGEESGKLIDVIEKELGTEEAHMFIDRVSLLGIKYLQSVGVSIGLDDIDLPAEAVERVKNDVEKIKQEINEMIKKFEAGEVELIPGMNALESLEAQILRTLTKALHSAEDVVSENLKENAAVSMARSGARGGMIHLVQMAACIGQEKVLGGRIHRGYRERTLSHFTAGELSAEAHGFVVNSFKSGLNPFEFFFDAMSGREGLMDKSLRTRHSGYMERRLMGALQDLRVEYDGTIRDNRKMIIQFVPGEDKIDPAKSEWGFLDVRNIVQSVLR